MSGHIGISSCSGVATSSRSFDHIVNAISPKLKAENEAVFRIVFRSYEASIISAASLNDFEFGAFARSVFGAFNEEMEKNVLTKDDLDNWDRLVIKIKADPRFK